MLLGAAVMAEEFANETVANLTSTSVSLSPDKGVSSDQIYACAVYILVIFGIVQLVVTIVGLVGNCTVIISSSFCSYFCTTICLWTAPHYGRLFVQQALRHSSFI